MNKNFEKLNDKLRSEIENGLQMAIVEQFRKEAMEENFYKYEVQLQNLRFITYMSDEELERSIKLTIDLLEEMRAINNDGMDEKEFRKKGAEIFADDITQEDLQATQRRMIVYYKKIYWSVA